MSFKPTSGQPDLETVGRILSALGEHYEKSAPTLKHLGAVALEAARQTGPSVLRREDQESEGGIA